MDKRLSFDYFNLLIAHTCRVRSLDGRTHHGAYIVDEQNKPVMLGYNGPVAGWPDELVPTTSPAKYPYMVHAERNAIVKARQDLSKCTIYISGYPCLECMQLICVAGIKRVVCTDFLSNQNRNDPNYEITLQTMIRWSEIDFCVIPCSEFDEAVSSVREEATHSNTYIEKQREETKCPF